MLWDLKSKKADYRYTYDEVRKSLPFPLLLKQLAVIPSPSDLNMYLLIKKLEIQSHINELNCIQLCTCLCASLFPRTNLQF